MNRHFVDVTYKTIAPAPAPVLVNAMEISFHIHISRSWMWAIAAVSYISRPAARWLVGKVAKLEVVK
jgi:hypothetical protein